ncbi:MAG TPA: MmcQ/YjbR family DNA-binding protein [Thermoanaerobaculia bacterium]
MTRKLPRKPAARRPSGARSGDLRQVARELRAYALSFPGATEDFPWGERVAKVKGKVFVFLGADPVPGGPIGFSVKLPASGQDALDLPFTKPTGYGLGKSGWVSATFETKDDLPLEILKGWIRESYCAVAPRKLVAELEGSGLKSLSRRSRSDRRG